MFCSHSQISSTDVFKLCLISQNKDWPQNVLCDVAHQITTEIFLIAHYYRVQQELDALQNVRSKIGTAIIILNSLPILTNPGYNIDSDSAVKWMLYSLLEARKAGKYIKNQTFLKSLTITPNLNWYILYAAAHCSFAYVKFFKNTAMCNI